LSNQPFKSFFFVIGKKVHAGERARRLQQEKEEMKAKNKKEALKEQMKIEQEERDLIKNIKEAEKLKASNEIEAFKAAAKLSKVVSNDFASGSGGEEYDNEMESNEKAIFEDEKAEPTPPLPPLVETDMVTLRNADRNAGPRASQTIQIKFTPRVFPTPQRESTSRQETEVGLRLLYYFSCVEVTRMSSTARKTFTNNLQF
jgi:dyslexia susceptibility 1 candidate gene 1 protein